MRAGCLNAGSGTPSLDFPCCCHTTHAYFLLMSCIVHNCAYWALAGGGRGNNILNGMVRGILSLGGGGTPTTPQEIIRALETEVEGLAGLCK
jgi:hypothetical protein